MLGPRTGKDAFQSLEAIGLLWKPHDVDTEAQTGAREAIPHSAQATLLDHLPFLGPFGPKQGPDG